MLKRDRDAAIGKIHIETSELMSAKPSENNSLEEDFRKAMKQILSVRKEEIVKLEEEWKRDREQNNKDMDSRNAQSSGCE